MSGTTLDYFLGGRLRIRQPARGYRAGIDPVLLAAAAPACAGESVLDLGTGSGIALLCLMARVPGLVAVGLERDPEMLRLAQQNFEVNDMSGEIVLGDVADPPACIRTRSFDHVIANPPFFDRAKGSPADPRREDGRGMETPIEAWMETAMRRLKPGGRLTLIHRVERLPDLLCALDGRIGDVAVLPIAARHGRRAKLVLLQAKKNGKGPFLLGAPFILHEGPKHVADGDDYSDAASLILRSGEALDVAALTGR